MQPKDLILEIDGVTTKGLSVEEAVKKIRGKKGTQVKLLVAREGTTDPFIVSITRDTITMPTIDTKDVGNDVRVISLYNFNAQSAGLFEAAIKEFAQSGRNRLVIDLRGNPGGYLESAVDMASYFVPAGKVIVTEDYGGNKEDNVHVSRGYKLFDKKPSVVVLVDKGICLCFRNSSDRPFSTRPRHHCRYDNVRKRLCPGARRGHP
jgi:carboxyl-terminal processing protease